MPGMSMDMGQLMGIPGANPGGSNISVPSAGGSSTPAFGSSQGNPFLPSFPSGMSMPGMTNPMGSFGTQDGSQGGGNDLASIISQISGAGFPANTGGPGGQGTNLGGFNLAGSFGLGQGDPNAAHNFVKGMRKAGFSSGVAGQLWNFINSGAGFNPQIANAMINFMQPQIQRGEADIMERFGSMGLGMSSPAAIGLGDYLSQVNLNEQEVFAQMMQQATQNYLQVLLGGKGPAPKNFFQNWMDWIKAINSGGATAAAGAF